MGIHGREDDAKMVELFASEALKFGRHSLCQIESKYPQLRLYTWHSRYDRGQLAEPQSEQLR